MPEPRRIPADSPTALALVDAMVAEVAVGYDVPDLSGGPSASPEDFSPPGGCFVALYDEAGRAVAGGGVKRLGPDVAELKRMYVVPDRRGSGLGRALLAALEDAARDLGYARVRLDTGPQQPEAEALYRASGYREIGNYNANPWASFWGEKVL
ncbi:MAG TPA: GNAT family N-acetyltransferase [Solirubrobacteraceae bacterium]|nr:GNAT family N-acetyltransferase [Solirubrobacteraceae bacterium]